MITQNENSIKTAEPGHVKSTTRMFAVGLCVCFFKENGRLVDDKYYRPILKLYPLKLSYHGEKQRCRSACESFQSNLCFV